MRGSRVLSKQFLSSTDLSLHNSLHGLLISVRPHQWIKNTLVFGGLIFSYSLRDVHWVGRSVLAFLCFCLATSAVYLFNDMIDLNEDRGHPEKQFRPIASGRVSFLWASVAASALLISALLIGNYLGLPFLEILAIYFFQNLAYSLWLKQYAILDVLIIAFGFVFRAIAGAIVVNVPPSPWLILCTLMLALLVGFGKRYHEVSLFLEQPKRYRQNLDFYSVLLLGRIMKVTGWMAILVYSLYTQMPETVHHFGTRTLGFTLFPVSYGVFRFQYLVRQCGEGNDPARLFLTDFPLLLSGISWVLSVGFILYISSMRPFF